MSWRTIYIDNATKLTLNLDNLSVNHNGEKYNIALNEIGMIIIEDYKTLISGRLISKCAEEGITIVFTSKNRVPVGAVHSYTNNSRTAKINKMQLQLTKNQKQVFWQQMIQIKIKGQITTLKALEKDSSILERYVQDIRLGDMDNKEGQASRVYFKILFGINFTRADDDIINYCLNYAFQVIRSKLTQHIIGRGLHPSFGFYHRSEYNYFNLADDLIEPYRPIVEYYIYKLLERYNENHLTPKLKEEIINILYYEVMMGNVKNKLHDSMTVYMNSIVNVITGKSQKIEKYPELIVDEQ